MAGGLGSQSGSRPNVLLITSDEERYTLPNPDGFVLPERERLQERERPFPGWVWQRSRAGSSRADIPEVSTSIPELRQV
jgi:hypothetical protein